MGSVVRVYHFERLASASPLLREEVWPVALKVQSTQGPRTCALSLCWLTQCTSPLTPVDSLGCAPETGQPVRGLLLSEPLTCLTRSATPAPHCPSLPAAHPAAHPHLSVLTLPPRDAGSGLLRAESSSSCLCPGPTLMIAFMPTSCWKASHSPALKDLQGSRFYNLCRKSCSNISTLGEKKACFS